MDGATETTVGQSPVRLPLTFSSTPPHPHPSPALVLAPALALEPAPAPAPAPVEPPLAAGVVQGRRSPGRDQGELGSNAPQRSVSVGACAAATSAAINAGSRVPSTHASTPTGEIGNLKRQVSSALGHGLPTAGLA